VDARSAHRPSLHLFDAAGATLGVHGHTSAYVITWLGALRPARRAVTAWAAAAVLLRSCAVPTSHNAPTTGNHKAGCQIDLSPNGVDKIACNAVRRQMMTGHGAAPGCAEARRGSLAFNTRPAVEQAAHFFCRRFYQTLQVCPPQPGLAAALRLQHSMQRRLISQTGP